MDKLDYIWKCLPPHIVEAIRQSLWFSSEYIEEIRLRIQQPLRIKIQSDWKTVQQSNGQVPILVTKHDIKTTISRLSAYSLYAFAEELRQGYITIAGGHRIGFCGKAVVEQGHIQTLCQISSLNIRIAKQIFGCADRILPYLFENNQFCHTLLVSPPGCGKTTLLREMIRRLASAPLDFTVGIADERGEIAGMCEGEAQMQLGENSDVISGCPKAEGMQMLLRSMSPCIIAADELGREEDFQAVSDTLHAGVKLLCTIHGNCLQEIQKRPMLRQLLEMGAIQRFVFLSNESKKDRVSHILDGAGQMCYKRKGHIDDTQNSRDDMHFGSNDIGRRLSGSTGQIPFTGFEHNHACCDTVAERNQLSISTIARSLGSGQYENSR